MDIDTKIDDLIEAGWYVLDSEFDDRALAHWKKTASEFFLSFLGPSHIVTQSFVYSWESRFELEIFPDKKGSDTIQ